MKATRLIVYAILLSGSVFFAPVIGAAQTSTTGAIEFFAQVKPAGGAPEPVRQISFYLLRKSVADIRMEVEQADPPPNMDSFIDGTSFSPELKAWMKKQHTIDFAGADFIKQLTADDVIDVPEFFTAYKLQNGAALGARIPEPKFKPGDQEKNPEKYKREHDQYIRAMHNYIEANLDSLDGLDADLRDINPARRWTQLQAVYQKKSERQVFDLAQTTYLAAKTDSNLDGRGALTELAPGAYWITTLDTPAMAGDLRVNWDVPVSVRAGETAHLELSNVNALDATEEAAR